MTLDEISIIAVYSAMVLYAIAFIAYSIDLAKRSAASGASTVAATASERVGVLAAAGASASSPSTPTKADAATSARPAQDGAVAYGRSPVLRVAVAMTVIAWLLHLSADVLRGIAAERVPWANMYEFALTGTLVITTVFLAVLVAVKTDLRFLGTFVTGLVLVLLGIATVNFYVSVVPLPPALQSVWLVIHVFVATSAVGFFALGFALSVVQLMQARREAIAATADAVKKSFLATLPDSTSLENLAYRVNIVGFILWTFTLMAGAIWAEKAWGRYWGWDTKEVWTFIIWVVYAGYIHARATRGWRGTRSAWLAIIGFSAVLFNFTVVNLFFKGLHAYSGL